MSSEKSPLQVAQDDRNKNAAALARAVVRADKAEAALDRVRELHKPDWDDWGIDHPEEGPSCSCGYNGEYPCPTGKAIRGEVE